MLKTQNEQDRFWANIGAAISALIGSGDAMYLTVTHLIGTVPPCSSAGCEAVLRSEWSMLFGIPIAAFGVVYYIAIFLTLLSALISEQSKVPQLAVAAVTSAAAISAGLLAIQLCILHAICVYCLVSALCSFTIFFFVYLTGIDNDKPKRNISARERHHADAKCLGLLSRI